MEETSWRPYARSPTSVGLALIVALVLAFNAAYSAYGSSHDETIYACVFAGSLSQVGTTPPSNCGRGTMISWNAESPAGVNTTNVRTGSIDGAQFDAQDATITNPAAGQYTISYPPGTFPFFDGAGIPNFPALTATPVTTDASIIILSGAWFTNGALSYTISTGPANNDFTFTITQHIPADATFASPFSPYGEQPAITIGEQ